jgi:formate hydrogenlyase transcriptional activator
VALLSPMATPDLDAELTQVVGLLDRDFAVGPDDLAIARLGCSTSPAMSRAVDAARQVADTDAPVLLTGETGTGKEVLSRAIHLWSLRREMPFVKVSCAALPANLIESELFGHVRGAFSGAVRDRPGRFVVANGGTLLLDEIGDMPRELQSKLLRILQEGVLQAVGSDRSVRVDVRIIAATHARLEEQIEREAFREDLYYRLSVFPIELPPLRERIGDIEQLAATILAGIHRRTGRGPWVLGPDALAALASHDWPGNLRELVNTLERACILAKGRQIAIDVLSKRRRPSHRALPAPQEWPSLEEVERAYIERVLQKTAGRLYGERGAAEILGLPPTTLQSRIARMGIERPRRPSRSG